MKKSILNAFEGAPPKEAEPPKSEWDVDELLGPQPRGFRKRWEWYQEIAKQEEEEKRENGM
jgi:hypothetical protein